MILSAQRLNNSGQDTEKNDNLAPDISDSLYRSAQFYSWTCAEDMKSWRMDGPDDGLSIKPEFVRHIKDLACIFDEEEICLIEAQVRLMRLDCQCLRPENTPRSCLITAIDGRKFIFKGQACEKTERYSGILCDLGQDLQPNHNENRPMDLLKRTYGGGDEHKIDALTGLYNRQGFLLAAKDMISFEGEFDLVVGDINRFRRLNEALGHERADLVLAMLAQRLKEAFPHCAILARLGEDEFAVLTHRAFPRVSERFRAGLERPIAIAGFDIQPVFSLGAVHIKGGDTSLDASELLRRAEMAIEASKINGAGGVSSYRRDLETDGLSQLALETDLRKAFVSGEIEAYFQPIIRLNDKSLAGFEALARWHHPRRGVIAPAQFLDGVRDIGMMADLGMIMMTKAAQRIATWGKIYGLRDDFFISVNLSAAEIERHNLVFDVKKLIETSGIPAHSLKLEVTESDVMRNPDESAKVLTALRDLGVCIALDDFGTGYSSLSYLAKLPIETLKIDRSFVATMKDELTSRKIVGAIVTLGRDLGLCVIAEGIELEDEALHLASIGCFYGQGYSFARPLRECDAEAFIKKNLDTVDK